MANPELTLSKVSLVPLSLVFSLPEETSSTFPENEGIRLVMARVYSPSLVTVETSAIASSEELGEVRSSRKSTVFDEVLPAES